MLFAILNLKFYCKKTLVDNKTIIDEAIKPYGFQAKLTESDSFDNKYSVYKIFLPLDINRAKTQKFNNEFSVIPKNNTETEKDTIIKYTIIEAFESLVDYLKTGTVRIQYELLDVKKAEDVDFLYSDGSSSFKPKCAASAMVHLIFDESALKVDPETRLTYDIETETRFINEGTNNIAELTGIESCLDFIKDNNIRNAIITSDSEYSIKSMREWYYSWKDNNYKSYSGKEISNKDLIIRIFNKINTLDNIAFRWTKGHAGHEFNEKCDELAKECIVNNLESLGE